MPRPKFNITVSRSPARRAIKRAGGLLGVAEVAEFLGVAGQNLVGPNAPAGMPEPVEQLKATRVWLADEIAEFRELREARRQGRPG